ncbi:hypothetical protein MNBD_GAMMA23-1742 [hydrothermal vent metagenome]|uniref:Nitrogen fixation protein FixH n=1 Tax=hydrothermal vent metagenome TaxID=652676 RepID=A0A3B1A431_9ZZZZ
MNNLLLTLAVGVIFIVIVHSTLRFFSRIKSVVTLLITFLALCSIYIPLLIADWPGVDIFAIQFAIYGVTLYLLTILHSQALQQKQNEKEGVKVIKKWHWAPLLIVGFFVVVVSVNSVFITVAQQGSDSLSSMFLIPEPKSGGDVSSYFPGIIEHNFHEKEDQYNQYQQRLDEQRQRGWEIKYGWIVIPVANKTAIFQLSLRDAKQQAITGAKVRGSFQRGNTSKQDQPVELKEFEAGVYRVDISLKYPGRWELKLKVDSSQGDYNINATTNVSK